MNTPAWGSGAGATGGSAGGFGGARGGFGGGAGGGFGGPAPAAPSGAPAAASTPVRAPLVWLAVAALLEVVGLGLAAAADDRPVLSVLGWVVGGFAAIGILAWFTVVDSRLRTDPWYDRTSGPALLRAVLVAGAVLVVAANSFRFADWVSRQ